MVTRRQIFNFDFLFGEISEKYDPFDWKTFRSGEQKYEAVATDVVTGTSRYFNLDNCSNITKAVMGSASLPILSKMVEVDGRKYLDGGVSTPVAYKRAFRLGYKKAVVVLTREDGYRKKPLKGVNGKIYKRYFRPLPRFTDKLMTVPERYNLMQEEMENLSAEGKLFIIRPQKHVVVKRLERSLGKLESLYNEGYEEGLKNIEAVEKFLSGK